MIGRTIGNYVVREKIGEGGMGVVYRAEHPHINRQVAIKVLHPGADRNAEVVHRFFNEARAATEIRNDHIVEVMDFGELPEGTPYLVMEWLEGESLGGLLRAYSKLPVERAAHIMRGIARALKAAHSKGVVHRDLKPDNVYLVSREGERDLVKVLDFGIAKLLATGTPVRYQTQTGAIIGTPAYMSPEQCRGAKEIDHRTDIYSLGVMGYQMLTGRLPFLADALGELLFKHMTETPPPAASLEPSVPPDVSDILSRALEKEPDRRPTLVELSAVMEQVEAHGGDFTTRPINMATGATVGGTAVMATTSGPVSAGLASNTTLGASASEIGIERRLQQERPRRGRFIVAGLVALGAVAGVVAIVTRHAPASETAPVAPPAPVVEKAAPEKTVVPAVVAPAPPTSVAVAIRTDPASARLTVDGVAVSNPFVKTLPADGRPHTIAATLPGFGTVSESMGFDRDREVVLRLIPDAPRAGGSSRSGRSKPSSSASAKTEESAGAAEAGHHGKPAGYRGSKLNIETEFPGSQ